MNLELKHLASYLPYDLQMRNIEDKTNHKLTIAHQTYDLSTVSLYPILNEEFYKTFKPILLPLSNITNKQLKEFYQFDSVDMELIDIEEWKEELVNMIKGNDKFQLSQFQKLFEWHFDVFGLIEKGLAVDINTLSVQNDG
jgi:hypothetical protein